MNKNKNIGCFSGILGTLAVVVGVGIYILVSSLFNRIFVSARFGNDAACALLNLSTIGITVAFVLYEIIFLAWFLKKCRQAQGNDAQTNRFKKLFVTVLIVCIAASLIFAVVSANTLTECRDDSISSVCFVTTKEYRWDTRCDILRYSLSCSPEGALSFKITMKDGKSFDIINSVNSCTAEFIEMYENLYGYAAYLDGQLTNSEYIIDFSVSGVEYMEKYYRDAYPEIWKYLDTIIAKHIYE